MMMRTLGRSGIKVSSLGLGCRALGEQPDAAESIRAIRQAVQLGINFFDTADLYGAGRGERLLGQALRHARDEVVIATKWGYTFDEATGAVTGQDPSPAHLCRAVEASLRRLQTDRIDLYQLHLGELPTETAADLLDPLERLVTEGKIRWYGWSTEVDDRAAAWGNDGPHCTAIQHEYSVRDRVTPDVLAICETLELASVVRRPLDGGSLAGPPAGGNPAASARSGLGLRQRLPVGRRSGIQEVLTSDGRTLVQGALAWLWARSPVTIPVAGCRTPAQVAEAATALHLDPLSAAQVETIAILSDLTWPGNDHR